MKTTGILAVFLIFVLYASAVPLHDLKDEFNLGKIYLRYSSSYLIRLLESVSRGVPVTFQARSYILKTKSMEWLCSF